MPTWIYFALKTTHVAAMAVWFGGPFVAGIGFREAVASGPIHGLAFVARLQRLTPVFVVAGLTTILTGAGLFVAGGGFSVVRLGVQAGAVLALLTFPLGGLVIRPTLSRLRATLETPSTLKLAPGLLSRFERAHWAEAMLKLSALVLMVAPVS